MDLYTVDPNTWLKQTVVEDWNALIWTERYNQYGDVTLVFSENSDTKDIVKEGVFLYTPDSKDIMLIDTVSTEKKIITCTGLSLTGFLMQRIFRNTWNTAKDNYQVSGTPGDYVSKLVQFMMMPSSTMAGGSVVPSAAANLEIFPKLSVGTVPTGTVVTIPIPYGQLYDAVKFVADLDNLGFRLSPADIMDGTGNLKWDVYRGLDRSSTQSTNGVVIFEPALDSLADTQELRSLSNYKTVAYVFPSGLTAQTQVGIVYVPGTEAYTTWQRRALLVSATDINVADYTDTALASVLQQKGKDALANNNYVRTVDGQIVPQSTFEYNVDYKLGDIIELRGDVIQKARIVEYIRSQDENGETAYPTLSVV